MYLDIDDFMKKIPMIGESFDAMRGMKMADRNASCVEIYSAPNVCRCMVKLLDEGEG